MNQVAFITGASSGLGRGLAVRMASDGWSLGLAARRVDELERTAEAVHDTGGRAVALPCDVALAERVKEAVARCEQELGPIDLVVANAGISGTIWPETLDSPAVDRVLRTNFMGTVNAVSAVLPGMLKRGRGQIVGVSSIAGYRGLPGRCAYSASKAAQANFLESLRLDLRGTGIRVTVLCPGFVRTPLTATGDYPKPFMLDLEPAVERMYQAIRKGRGRYAFPLPLALLAGLGRIFPTWLYDLLAGRFRRELPPGLGPR
jgi:NAD(P)-dependent dehydrogenase (short-subunit alcohol dehydrogenase family)